METNRKKRKEGIEGMKPISVSPALKKNWERMKNEYIAPMTASLLLWLESNPQKKQKSTARRGESGLRE